MFSQSRVCFVKRIFFSTCGGDAYTVDTRQAQQHLVMTELGMVVTNTVSAVGVVRRAWNLKVHVQFSH